MMKLVQMCKYESAIRFLILSCEKSNKNKYLRVHRIHEYNFWVKSYACTGNG